MTVEPFTLHGDVTIVMRNEVKNSLSVKMFICVTCRNLVLITINTYSKVVLHNICCSIDKISIKVLKFFK